MKLPICGDCSRRTLLKGLGIAAAVLAVPGCMQAGSNLPSAASASCGQSLCIDLTNAANKDLTTVGGAMLLDTSSDTIMVIRQSSSDVVALSAICTHSGCSMNFNASQQLLDCPCHGSQFDESGNVLRGPANRPLRVYQTSLDTTTNTITVTL